MSTLKTAHRNTWMEIDLKQLATNVEILRSVAQTQFLVVVKANAYGHGLVECSRALESAGASMLGVATLGESAELRAAGIRCWILRITAYGLDEISEMIEQAVDFFVWEEEQLKVAQATSLKQGKVARVHLQVDTGMGREGLFADQVLPFAQNVKRHSSLELVGLCSHFYLADSKDTSSVERQLSTFRLALHTLEEKGLRPPLVHLANSPGLLRFPDARFDMVRSGVITYGLPYEEGFPLPDGVKPIASWKARIVSLRELPPGHVVSYGGQYVTSGVETIGIIPVGYADGLHRFPKDVNEVLWRGRRVPTVGRICMDQAMIKLPSGEQAQLGDEVVILGTQLDAEISSIDVANRWGTNNYDVLCNIRSRVPRVFFS